MWKTAFKKFYSVRSWMLCYICDEALVRFVKFVKYVQFCDPDLEPCHLHIIIKFNERNGQLNKFEVNSESFLSLSIINFNNEGNIFVLKGEYSQKINFVKKLTSVQNIFNCNFHRFVYSSSLITASEIG